MVFLQKKNQETWDFENPRATLEPKVQNDYFFKGVEKSIPEHDSIFFRN
jgi:hypothetical protein